MTRTIARLFTVSSTIDNWSSRWGVCDGLYMQWFVHHRETSAVRYEEVIPGFPYAQARWDYETGAIDELFTEAEAEELRAYLATFPATTVDVQPCPLPLPPNVIGVGAVAVGGDDDFYMLSDTEGYSLSVPVWGYYSLNTETVRWRDRATAPDCFGLLVCSTDKGIQIDFADEIASRRYFERTGRFVGDKTPGDDDLPF